MKEFLIQLVSSLPAEWATFWLAAVPVTELRAAIPVAIGIWQLDPTDALGWALLGNALPALIVEPIFAPASTWLSRQSAWWHGIFEKLFAHTRAKMTDRYQRYGLVALVLFVAIPLPGTGVWTGALAAWLFGIPMRRAVPAIWLGMVIAGLIITLVTTGVIRGVGWLV